MTLSTKQKYILAGAAVIMSFAVGRFSAQQAEVKTEISAKTQVQQDKEKNTHKETTITTIKTPDGTVKTVKQINEVSNTKTDTVSNTDVEKKVQVLPPKINTLNISALIAADTSRGFLLAPAYGVSVTKQILGPVTAGAFALTSGVLGVSIGLNF